MRPGIVRFETVLSNSLQLYGYKNYAKEYPWEITIQQTTDSLKSEKRNT